MWSLILLLVNAAGYMCSDDHGHGDDSAQDHGEDHGWTYEFESKWPGQCNAGNMQSPINVVTADAIMDKNEVVLRGPLVFRGYTNVNMAAENNGHTVKWMVEPDAPAPLLSGGPLRGNYSFIQFHLHWLSEHAIDGKKFPVEIHFVHMKTGLSSEEALKRPDGLAVVAVMGEVSSGPDSEYAFEQIAPALPDLVQRSQGKVKASYIDLTRLLSPETQSYYTYHGSLTTPQCQEIVTWIVMDKPITVGDGQYKLLSKIDVGGINNYRSLQPANRMVYRSIASCAAVAAPSSIGLMASLINFSASLSTTFSRGICALVNIKRKIFGNAIKECTDKGFPIMCVLTILLGLSYLDVSTSLSIEDIKLEDLTELEQPSTLCEKVGWRQSPINIEDHDTIKDFERMFIKYGHLKFYGYHNVLMTGVNDGKNIRFIADGDQSMRPRVTGGPLERFYYLTEVTFRYPSEHALDGGKYPMEIQLVHVRDNLTLTTARHFRDGLAIFSVFSNISEPENITHRHPTDEIHDFLPELTKTGKLSGLLIDLRDILVPANGIFYTYMGSLTVPDCNEIVIWIVFKNPIYKSYESYSIITEEGTKPSNSRALQELRRHIVYQPPEPFFATPVAVQNLVSAVTNMVGFIKEVSLLVFLVSTWHSLRFPRNPF
ncbi:uncharacterized protein LOC121740515 [Aricia agestis]|uniref:uncharacterized protein LOC121740515 n=1 Tax=Aricia agestis TaxID=91739 RepID=UPI001C205DB3|nr:uncharacterized protein LOC121740515 [Aricia agestis]